VAVAVAVTLIRRTHNFLAELETVVVAVAVATGLALHQARLTLAVAVAVAAITAIIGMVAMAVQAFASSSIGLKE
jgi:hypothetical protein